MPLGWNEKNWPPFRVLCPPAQEIGRNEILYPNFTKEFDWQGWRNQSPEVWNDLGTKWLWSQSQQLYQTSNMKSDTWLSTHKMSESKDQWRAMSWSAMSHQCPNTHTHTRSHTGTHTHRFRQFFCQGRKIEEVWYIDLQKFDKLKSSQPT